MHPHTTTTRRAFTLLELLLAVAVFSSIATLGATLYLQATRIGAAPVAADRSLALQRVVMLAHDQWDNRRVMMFGEDSDVRAEAMTVAAVFAPGKVSFVTASPVLFPDWPLVRVTYRIERRLADELDASRGASGDAGSTARFALVYTEPRSTDPSAPPESSGRTPDGERRSASMVLVAPCESLGLERFGPPEPEEAPDPPAPSDGRPQAETEDSERDPLGWHRYDEAFDGPVYAVRFVGSLHGDRFTCTFLAEPSR